MWWMKVYLTRIQTFLQPSAENLCVSVSLKHFYFWAEVNFNPTVGRQLLTWCRHTSVYRASPAATVISVLCFCRTSMSNTNWRHREENFKQNVFICSVSPRSFVGSCVVPWGSDGWRWTEESPSPGFLRTVQPEETEPPNTADWFLNSSWKKSR